ncbi:MAG: carbon starvation protein A [Spirochaetes bacterium]|jgi:carbon starvation protein|nr:carbon starvation protein A [Spirochaetota bacterium]
MNVLAILVVSAAILYLGYRFYAPYIEKLFDVDGSHVTPAVEINDGVDYVPTRRFVIFGHHFASIAGGGPIIGPTVALVFGFLPVWLWIIIGTLFIGAVHDFSALLASMREKGRSIAEIAERTFGKTGFLLFISFTIIMLLMVTSVFLTLTTTALSSKYPLEHFGVTATQIQTVVENGVTYAVVGGIASTSVIIITGCAPVIGFLLYKKGINTLAVSVLALFVCAVSIEIGLIYPIKIDTTIWMIILSIYTLIAAGIPVWLILQPRDFTNSFLLYGGIAGMIGGTIVLGAGGATINAPLSNISSGNIHLGYVWPILFITIACGAISGFHALVAGGTTAKQISKESPDAKVVGYGGMALEALLALGVVIAVGYGLQFDKLESIVFPADPAVKSNPILAFALGMGGLLNSSFGLPIIYGAVFGILMVEGFVVTTLDTAVRLNRYLLEELWRMLFKNVPKLLGTYIFNSFLCVALMFILAYFNAFKQLWALFGSANQLLAALTLITISMWLLKRGKKHLFALIPGIFMFITTIASLVVILAKDYIPKRNYMLAAGDVLLIFLSLGVAVLVVKSYRGRGRSSAI